MQKVQIILGSSSDEKIMRDCQAVLQDFGVECKTDIASAHRSPEKLEGIVRNSPASVFIAIAGLSAALPGAIASHTTKPVIGVPVNVKLGGLDALLSVMQLPSGIPVATVGIDNGKNAALIAVEILALSDTKLAVKLAEYRSKMHK